MDKNIFQEYINNLKSTVIEDKTELTDRVHLEKLLDKLKPSSKIQIQHEPKRHKEGLGAPDFIIRNNGNIIGYIEVKKIEQNLDDTLKSPQIEKYKQLSNNILLTNYIEFIWIKNGNLNLREVLVFKTDLEKNNTKIDNAKSNKIVSILNEFFKTPDEKIESTEKLASLLARRTKILKDLVEQHLDLYLSLKKQNTLVGTYSIIKGNIYNNELKVSEFADSIAQTITYGFFLAKLNNTSNSRIDFDNIKKFIPNNFALIQDILKLIDNIASSREYDSIRWVLEELIDIVNNIDSNTIFEQFSFTQNVKSSDNNVKDPYLYFYEDFLAKYDKSLRKNKGVYYTPHSVVNFIVSSLNKILKYNFGLENGFANREEVTVLDFATGTGTFLLEVIKCILKEIPKQTGKQKDYINDHILKNIYGFEYLMAPYAVAHLKLCQFLKKVCDFKFGNEHLRPQIFLTNTLDVTLISNQESFKAFFPAISEENKLVNEIKNKPILVILGNPPYNAESKNNNNYILNLIKSYKTVDNTPLNEKNIVSLNDDYVKFIRFSEHKIEIADEGLLGIITNNGYLDNITFRGMRYHLLKTFDEIYILNLHGNLRKKEKTDTGKVDENVFDIQTGVAIAIFIKYKEKSKQNKLANVYYKGIKGSREEKYSFLDKNTIFSIDAEKLKCKPPNYLFIKKDLKTEDVYSKGVSLEDIFIEYIVGIETQKDKIAIDFTEEELLSKLNDLAYLDEQIARYKYDLKTDSTDWKLPIVQRFLKSTNIDAKYVKKIAYRPFDNRFIYYTENKGVIARPRYKVMRHILEIENNISFFSIRTLSLNDFHHALVSCNIMDKNFFSGCSYVFPLYIKEDQGMLGSIIKENFKTTFKDFINFKYSKEFDAKEILGYIYAVLYSNIYRTKFIEFLKIDFPKIIFVDSVETFEKLSKLGIKLINVHLMKNDSELDSNIGIHIGDNNHIIEKIFYNKDTKELYYNSLCKFINTPYEVYEYFIGAYQVLRSYLKYRKGRELSIEDIEYLEKVIKILDYTINIQKQIDLITCKLKEFDSQNCNL
ncbi:type ISP restriction/modification enzyme [Borrelia hermsii]|uniref:site-specific DNA-methyltransferase (adenine-specific) n=3 Tax=Borrelia hermsii TaxID=140 RepID=Q8KQC8_BORHE|nr:type ISP restriction/modification enzyme [Borrelia hermsii]AAM49818.1 putative methylase [Borrelia hermsii]AMR76233.1 DNA methyltransferase [Borrelia hermsii]ANA43957.1 methylase [Borrelia hermsii HS1]UPA08417.1 N-6 DNA methylase [Borrelia hermsii DAH]